MPEPSSTAITTSAPSARHRETGTGLTNPPSTSTRPLRRTGENNPGKAIDACTASATLPSRNQTSRPVDSSVATHANGTGKFEKSGTKKCSAQCWTTRSPRIRPPPFRLMSSIPTTSCQSSDLTQVPSCSIRPETRAAPTSAPIEHPQTTSGRMPCCASACTTPICAQPRAAPLPSARPITGLPSFLVSGVESYMLPPASAQGFGIQVVDIAVSDPHPNEFTRFEFGTLGNDH